MKEKYEITQEQKDYLATIFHNQSMLILGGAGTGKSVLALETMRKQIEENSKSKILYLCSNTPFKQEIKDFISNSLKFSKDNISVDNFTNHFGINFQSIKHGFRMKTERKKVMKHVKELGQYSLIILDEAQELPSELLYDIKILANGSKFYVFGDEEQRIQNRVDEEKEGEWRDYLEIPNPIKLKKNYRNPKNIVSLANKFLPSENQQFASRDDEANISVEFVEGESELGSEISKFGQLRNQLRIISILPDTWGWRSSILNEFSNNQVGDWLTVKQALGVECDNVIIVVETLDDSKLKSFLYTAITRTLGDLKVIFYCGKNKFGRDCSEESIQDFKKSELGQKFSEFEKEEGNGS